MPSSRDASWVSFASSLAAIWSIDTDAYTSAPVVSLNGTQVRNVPAERAWSPPPVTRVRGFVVEPAAHQHAVLEAGQRLQRRRQLRERPHLLRGPVGHRHPVGHVEHAQPADGRRRGPGERSERRHHAVEQRQRQRRAQAAQHGAPRQMHLADEHGWSLPFLSCRPPPPSPPAHPAPGASGTARSPRCRAAAPTSAGRCVRDRRRAAARSARRSSSRRGRART